jgi:zinc transport system substrate-binding protein
MMRRNKMSAYISRIFLVAVMTGAIVFWTARGQATQATNQAKTTECWVSILPQKFFVERIGGGHVGTHVLVGPGQSPATFEPTGRQLTRLADADVFFSIGVAYEESLIPKIIGNFPDVRIVDVSSGVPRRQIEGHRHNDANEPRKVNEPHALVDPHIWLSPRLAIQISANILMALCDIDSARCDEYTRNFEGLRAELLETDRTLARILAPHAGSEIFVFHPAYGYFTDAYGLRQTPIEFEGASPGPKHLASVIDHAEALGVTTIFVQPQFSTSTARTVARTLGADLDTLDPLAEDYPRNLIEMAKKIAAALTTKTARD